MKHIGSCFLVLFIFLTIFKTEVNGQKDSDKELDIEYIDLIHCSHTDYGYTDHPVIIEELQPTFLDIAIDAAGATSQLPVNERFCWTAEALDVVWEWWKRATPERRLELIRLIDNGQIDISALPYNLHPFLTERQWDLALHWIPEDLWQQLHPKVGIQHDVNGFSRAAAVRLLDKGIRYIWNGINTYWGGAPFPQPSGFWWKMPDGRKILVWQSLPYWYGYNLFTEKDWRYIQSTASNTQFRTPRIGDILRSDEISVREAHRICLEKIKNMQKEGYSYDFIAICITNQWRIDNDGPFPPLVDFIKKWNELNLKPELRLTTASDAMAGIEKRAGKNLPVYEGEWPDWWAFGGAASPRDLAASRHACNYLQAALSPVWGGNGPEILNKVKEIDRLLCRYCEHTFSANEATSNPYGLFTQGHLAEKSIYAYRPYEKAQWLTARRMRSLFTKEKEGLYVVNAGEAGYTGWIDLDRISFREKHYCSAIDPSTGHPYPLHFNDRNVRFWISGLKAGSYQRFLLSEDSVPAEKNLPVPEVTTDRNGWPQSAKWKGMEQPLFAGDIGKFLSLESTIGRGIEPAVWDEKDSLKRAGKVTGSTRQIPGTVSEAARITETSYSLVYTQHFTHPRLKEGVRILEIWKNEPRISLDIRFNRISSANPEIFYVEFPLPDTGAFPVISNGGMEFLPYRDQIPGTCTDFFTTDGWVNYPAQDGSRLWSSRDTPLISFSGPQLASKRKTPPENMNTVLAMIYNNLWEVNFLDDCPGDMQFRFDLFWRNRPVTTKEAFAITQTYHIRPLVMLNPVTREDEFTFKRLNEVK